MSAFIFLQGAQPADWTLFLGRFHPLMVHLPIGFLLMAGLLELDRLTRRNSVSPHTITLILFWSAVSATMACGLGYLLAQGGDYEAETLDSHKWQGIGVAIFAWIAWAVKSENLGRRIRFAQLLYLPALGTALVLLLAAGHQGGNLTHGSDYLTQHAPEPLRTLAGLPGHSPMAAKPITDVNQAMVYEQIINPILQTRCVQCHNADKAKGGLRLDTPEQIRIGYEDGPVLVAGKSARSELIRVCLRPEDDDLHMPPKGKKQLTEGQIALLAWWIDEGAPFDKTVASLHVTEAIRPILASLVNKPVSTADALAEGSTESPVRPATVLTMNLPAPDAQAVAELQKAGLLVLPLSKEQNQLEVSAVNARTFNDAQARLLLRVSEQLVWLKLSNTAITDAALGEVAKLKHLQKLHLAQTSVTDAGLGQLKSLPNLESLNLYGTAVSDAGLAELVRMNRLKTVYLWQTRVTQAGLTKLKKARPDLEIVGGLTEQSVAAFAKAGTPEARQPD